MQDQIPMTIDGQPPEPRRTPRGRAWAIAGAGAVVLTLGGGAVALAAGQNNSQPSSTHYGYGSGEGPGAGGPGAGGPGAGRPGAGRPGAVAPKPHLDGKVKSVSGTKILITDRDGFTRTINTSGATKYSDSLTASPAVGTELHAEGTVDADGTSLDATAIGKMPAGGLRGGPGHGGPGGPGGPGGTRPSGAPSGTPSGAPSAKPSPAPTA